MEYAITELTRGSVGNGKEEAIILDWSTALALRKMQEYARQAEI